MLTNDAWKELLGAKKGHFQEFEARHHDTAVLAALPSRLFINRYVPGKSTGIDYHRDFEAIFGTVVIKLSGGTCPRETALRVKTSDDVVKHCRLPNRDGVLFACGTQHAVPLAEREQQRVTLNMFI